MPGISPELLASHVQIALGCDGRSVQWQFHPIVSPLFLCDGGKLLEERKDQGRIRALVNGARTSLRREGGLTKF